MTREPLSSLSKKKVKKYTNAGLAKMTAKKRSSTP
jgi:hypothetical protein